MRCNGISRSTEAGPRRVVASSPRPDAEGAERPAGRLQRIEDGVLALLLGAMIVLASLQIAMRWLLGAGLAWVDPTVRVLVLWVGLLGAVAASREGRHITVDVLSRMLPERPRAAAGAVAGLFTAAVSALVAWHAARFVVSELRYESVAFSGIPAWVLESVIPFSFAAIALRTLWAAASDAVAASRGAREGESA